MIELNERNMARVLRKILSIGEGHVKYYWQPYHQMHESDERLPVYGKWSMEEVGMIKRAISWGYLIENEVEDEHHVDDFPDGASHYVSVSLSGFEFVNEKGKPWIRKQISQLSKNIVTIFVAVVITLLSAWLLELTGLNK